MVIDKVKECMGAGCVLWVLYRLTWMITEVCGWHVVPVSDTIDMILFGIGFFGLMTSDLWKFWKSR